MQRDSHSQNQANCDERDGDVRHKTHTPQSAERDENQRQENIEVLFDGERPRVSPHSRGIALQKEKFRDKLGTVTNQWTQKDRNCEKEIKRRIDLQPPPNQEPGQLNSAVLLNLRKQKSGNQESG